MVCLFGTTLLLRLVGVLQMHRIPPTRRNSQAHQTPFISVSFFLISLRKRSERQITRHTCRDQPKQQTGNDQNKAPVPAAADIRSTDFPSVTKPPNQTHQRTPPRGTSVALHFCWWWRWKSMDGMSTLRPSSPCAWRCGDRFRGSSSSCSWLPSSASGRSPSFPTK